MAEPVLSVRGLTKAYGGVTALDSVDLDVAPGETLGVLGPNGAGKSTFVGLISGALRPTSGRVILSGREISGLDPAARARLGVGRTYQIPRPFGRMTVLENLMLAARHARGGHAGAGERCREILERTGLDDVAAAPAGELPLLRRKRLELARALALRPRLLLLDEIGAGLVESETRELIALIGELRGEVGAIVLIEHVLDIITECCDRAAVLDFGRLIATGRTREVLRDSRVAAVYLGASGEGGDRRPAARPGREPGAPLLKVRDLSIHYGGVRALRGVGLEVAEGEAVALLGANGAGKTTLARAISGIVRPTGGVVEFAGRPLAGMRPEQVTRLGVAHCMEGRRVFGRLTVKENLILGAGDAPRAERERRLAEVYDVFPALAEYQRRPGTAMSGGQQQMLAIGRALMSAPRLIIFDEISLGLAPVAVERLYQALERIRATGVTMLLVEQNIERGLALADRAYVLSHGTVQLSGTAARIRDSPVLRALYIGETAPQDHPTVSESR